MGVHRGADQFQFVEIEMTEDRVDVRTLREEDGLCFMVALDFNTKKPMKFTKIGDFDVLPEGGLEGQYELERYSSNGAVIDVDGDNNKTSAVSLIENSLINHQS